MTSLPYVLIVLFALDDGSVFAMRTSQSLSSPPTCSMQAVLENEAAGRRTHVCVLREHATALAGPAPDLVSIRQPPVSIGR